MYGDIKACFRPGNASDLDTRFLASASEQEHSSSTSHTIFYSENDHMVDTAGMGRRMEKHMKRQVIENEMD